LPFQETRSLLFFDKKIFSSKNIKKRAKKRKGPGIFSQSHEALNQPKNKN
jgi:hypothetical protein